MLLHLSNIMSLCFYFSQKYPIDIYVQNDRNSRCRPLQNLTCLYICKGNQDIQYLEIKGEFQYNFSYTGEVGVCILWPTWIPQIVQHARVSQVWTSQHGCFANAGLRVMIIGSVSFLITTAPQISKTPGIFWIQHHHRITKHCDFVLLQKLDILISS